MKCGFCLEDRPEHGFNKRGDTPICRRCQCEIEDADRDCRAKHGITGGALTGYVDSNGFYCDDGTVL